MATTNKLPNKLVTISASAYCEKARWALQAASIPFSEEAHAPLFHLFATKPKGGRSVPLLVLDGKVLPDSAVITAACAARGAPWLHAPREARDMELYFDTKLGTRTRQVAYQAVYSQPSQEIARKVVLDGVSGIERTLARLVFPLIRLATTKGYKVNAETAKRSLERVHQICSEVESRIGDGPLGSRFICGDTLSAADIAFCSHMSLLLLPTECATLSRHFGLEDLDANTRATLLPLRNRRAGQFALFCYRTFRNDPARAAGQGTGGASTKQA
eukprot:jgi/Mesvir1/24551/Mv21888-RA.1